LIRRRPAKDRAGRGASAAGRWNRARCGPFRRPIPKWHGRRGLASHDQQATSVHLDHRALTNAYRSQAVATLRAAKLQLILAKLKKFVGGGRVKKSTVLGVAGLMAALVAACSRPPAPPQGIPAVVAPQPL